MSSSAADALYTISPATGLVLPLTSVSVPGPLALSAAERAVYVADRVKRFIRRIPLPDALFVPAGMLPLRLSPAAAVDSTITPYRFIGRYMP